LAATQCLYQNAFFVLAICLGGMAVTIRHRLWQRTALILAVGGIAAFSLVPYFPVIRQGQQFVEVYQHHVGVEDVITGFADTLNSSSLFMAGVWGTLLALAAGLAVAAQFPLAVGMVPAKRDLALYCGVVGAVSFVTFARFLMTLGYSPEKWHLVPLLALTAVLLDAMSGVLPESLLRRFLVLCLLVGVVAVSFPTAWRVSRERHTNVDRIAARLAALAAKDDLIVLTEWYSGITFQRHYRGTASWITLPELHDFDVQREDELRVQLATPNAAAPVLERIRRTLQSGNRVWLLGAPIFLPEGKPLPSLPPAPFGPDKWYFAPYGQMWRMETGSLLKAHALTGAVVMPRADDVSEYENSSLAVYEGWR
jgi:hypothetical protein